MARRITLASSLPTLLIAAACGVACAGLWSVDGIVSTRAGGDSPFLLIRTQQLVENITSGAWPAHWMPDAAFGLGYPFYTFYASLPYYFAALINLLGLDLITGIKLTQTIGIVAAALGMRACARDWLPEAGAALAAVAYTLAPFHLANIYVRGDSLSELWAFVWYPLILAGVTRMARADTAPDAGGILRVAAPLAALVLTHNVSTLLFAPCVVVWSCVLLWHGRAGWRKALSRTLALAAAALLAASLSAGFWLPALGEAGQAQLDEQTTGYFNYANHFRQLGLCAPRLAPPTCAHNNAQPETVNLVQSALLTGFNDSDGLRSFGMGMAQVASVLLGTLAWLTAKGPMSGVARSRALVLGLFASTTFMLTPESESVWRALTPLQIAQFPWRWLSVQALFGALLAGGVAQARRAGASAALTTSAVLIALPVLALIGTPGPRALAVRPIDVNSRSLQLFEWYSGIIGTTIRHEYFPASALPVPATGPDLLGQPRLALIAQDGVPASALQSALLSIDPEEQEWLLRVDADSLRVTLPLMYSPAWTASASDTGEALALTPYNGSGWASLVLPRGEHRVRLRHTGTPLQQASETAAVCALALAIVLLLRALQTRHRAGLPRAAWLRPAAGLALTLALLALLVFGSRLILRHARAAPSSELVDFAQQPFVHRGAIRFDPPTGASPGTTATLTSATIEPKHLRAGDAFTLTLTWAGEGAPLELVQELPSASEALALFRHGRVRTPIVGNSSVHTMPLESLPGPTLLMLTPVAGWTSPHMQAYVSGKNNTGITVIGPTVTGTPRNAPEARVVTFANGIRAHMIDWLRPDGESVCFRAQWSRAGAVNRADALQVSFKLYGADGRLVAQADAQPQSGLAPTWSWQDDVVVHDSRCVRVIDSKSQLAQGEAYRLNLSWYRRANLEVTGQADLHGLADMSTGALNAPRP